VNNYDLSFAIAYSYLQIGNAENALPLFTTLAEKYAYPELYWYQALAFLKLDQLPECKEALSKLQNEHPTTDYAKEAKALSSKL